MKWDLLRLRQQLGYMSIQEGGMVMIVLLCELLDRLSQEEIDEILKKHGLKK